MESSRNQTKKRGKTAGVQLIEQINNKQRDNLGKFTIAFAALSLYNYTII